MLLAGAGVWLAAGLAANGPGWLRAQQPKGNPALAAYDPAPGSLLAKEGRGRRLMVHIGACGSCSVAGFDPAKVIVPSTVRVTVLYSGKPGETPREVKSLPPHWEARHDPDGALQSKLNLYFAPRWFEVGPDGRLTWIAKAAGDLPPGVRRAR